MGCVTHTHARARVKDNDVQYIKQCLKNKMEALLHALYPDKKIAKSGNSYRIGNHGSLVVSFDGLFHDKELDEGGDAIDLIKHALACDFKSAIAFINGFLGNTNHPKITLGSDKYNSLKSSELSVKHSTEERTDKALTKWRKALPIQGTLAERYLINRGITITPPPTLRYIERLWNFTTGSFHPAMVAAIQDVNRKITGIHCIFLDREGNKISGEDTKPKLIFGISSGSAVRLSPLTSRLILCEGIEDGLSVLQAYHNSNLATPSIWATLGTSGLSSAKIPDEVNQITIAGDNDVACRRAINNFVKKNSIANKRITIAFPQKGKDFNELLQMKGE